VSLPLEFRREARRDFDDGFDWYETQRPGLGRRFSDAVEATLRGVAAHPTRFAIVHADVRKATVKRFPYAVLYRADPQRVEVLAVFHAKRDPAVWRDRG
jgi:plasmid stabilization system protein ParE